jgi:hypothetical protein
MHFYILYISTGWRRGSAGMWFISWLCVLAGAVVLQVSEVTQPRAHGASLLLKCPANLELQVGLEVEQSSCVRSNLMALAGAVLKNSQPTATDPGSFRILRCDLRCGGDCSGCFKLCVCVCVFVGEGHALS